MRGLRHVFQDAGYTVGGVATAAVADSLSAETGISSRTLAQWFAAPDQLSELDVLVVDEANLTEDRQRAQLYRLAQQYDTRIIEVGDALQLHGVGVGSLFWRIHQLSGGPPLEDNRRQAHEDRRAAIAAWRDGQFTEALQSWDRRGRFVTADSGKDVRAAMLARLSVKRRC